MRVLQRLSIRWSVCFLGAWVFAASVMAQSRVPAPFIALQPEETVGEGGAQKVLFGDPSKPGLYVVQITFMPGKGSRPHFHDQDRFVTVIKGTWYVALGPESDTYNPDKMMAMKAGSFVYHPAMGHHYDGAKDEPAVVRIMGMGPVSTTNLEKR
jgi:quercetin dioxygenase-like cupin family protein